MIVHEGLIGAFNYAIGPALIYESWETLNTIRKTGDPYIVIVPDTIPVKLLFSTDCRRVRGFVLAHCEKDSVFTGYVITQRRASVRCVPAILDDIAEGRLKNGDLIAVDGVNGKVFVQPDAETVARFEALRETPQPKVTTVHIPRLAREGMQTANLPEIPAMPPAPELPDMLMRDTWRVAPGPDPTPKDMPKPADIRREVELVLATAESSYKMAKVTAWQTAALVHVSLFRDELLSPEEIDVLNDAVSDELARLEAEKKALEPPPLPPREKTWHEKWGLTPPTAEEEAAEPPDAREARTQERAARRREREAEIKARRGDGDAAEKEGDEPEQTPASDDSDDPREARRKAEEAKRRERDAKRTKRQGGDEPEPPEGDAPS